MTEIKIIAALALFVLFITLFNFFNLRYVFVLRDSKPFKIFRFAGARKSDIFFFQAAESFIYSLLATIAGIILVWVTYPYFNQLMGKQAEAGIADFAIISAICLLLFILIATVSGLLPIIILKASGIIKALSTSPVAPVNITNPKSRSGILKSLVSVQYIATFILIIALVIVHGQIKLFMENSLGKNKEQLLCLKGMPVQAVNRYQVFKQELLLNPLIREVTSSMQNPSEEILDMMGFTTTGLSGDSKNKLIYVNPVDDNFFDFYDFPIIAGSNFPKYTGDDSVPESFILNKKAIEYLGWEIHEALDRPFRLNNQFTSATPGRIVGVVENFQPSTMKEKIRPYVFFQKSFWMYNAQVRYDTSRAGESLAFIQDTWNKVYPDHPIEYEFVDNLYKEIYKGEFQLRNMSMLLCILALILSATGLFGITAITYEARTKEIGIRKVNGASILKVIHWLLKDIFIVVSVALIIAIPLAYFLTTSWLKSYVYHISPSIWIYLLASSILVVLALITVGWQTWRTATRNPVESLRYE